MKKTLLILLALFVVLLVGLKIFVYFYLTDERIRTTFIPLAEESLNCKLEIAQIEVSLLSGISLKEFSFIKNDLPNISIEGAEFSLKYSLLPLLTKKAKLQINTQQLRIRDSSGQLPTIESRANLGVTVDLRKSTASAPIFHGRLNLTSDITYGSLEPQIIASCDFNQNKLHIEADASLEKEAIHISALISDYLKSPSLQIDLSSQQLNIEYLAGLANSLPEKPAPPETAAEKKDTEKQVSGQPAAPPVSGQISITKMLYKDLVIDNFSMHYNMTDNQLNIESLTALLADGNIAANAKANLGEEEPTYHGSIELNKIELSEILTGIQLKSASLLSGRLYTYATFNGKGLKWPELGDHLNAKGEFSLTEGRANGLPLTRELATLLNIEELNDLQFQDISGDLQIKDGIVRIKSSLKSDDLTVKTDGTAKLNGKLDLPLEIKLSPKYSAMLKENVDLAQYLTDNQGRTTLDLRVTGSINDPQIGLDGKGVEKQLKKTAEVEARKELDRIIKSNSKGGSKEEEILKDLGGELLKGLFNN